MNGIEKIMPRTHQYVIRSDEGYWNNCCGWVHWLGATLFTQHDHDALRLPVGFNVRWEICDL